MKVFKTQPNIIGACLILIVGTLLSLPASAGVQHDLKTIAADIDTLKATLSKLSYDCEPVHTVDTDNPCDDHDRTLAAFNKNYMDIPIHYADMAASIDASSSKNDIFNKANSLYEDASLLNSYCILDTGYISNFCSNEKELTKDVIKLNKDVGRLYQIYLR